MAYSIDKKTGKITISGFEQGIAPSPHKGIGNMQNVNISTESGEIMSSYNRVLSSNTGGTGTLTQVTSSTVSFSGTTPLAGQWIHINNAGSTGLSGNYYYYGGGQLSTFYTPISSLPLTQVQVNVLIVGGGGGGANSVSMTVGGGGGGGGGVISDTNYLTTTTYTVTVGYGGTNNSTSTGGTSTFNGQSALGGTGTNNGSGGAAASGGGLGGASTANGTVGTTSSITGSPVTYGDGGGGGQNNNGVSQPGPGSPNGGANQSPGGNGTTNTGSGGGGGGNYYPSGSTENGGTGASGVVIISAPIGVITAIYSGNHSTTATTDYWTFNSSGTFQITAIASKNLIVNNITSGSATYSIYTMGSPVQSASEIYTASDGSTQYRYYILDKLGQLWINDTFIPSLGWFLSEIPSQTFTLASGLGVLNGWVSICLDNVIYWKNTSTLDVLFATSGNLLTKTFHSTLVGHQGKMYWTDGNFIASMFPNSSILSGAANIQSEASYTSATVTGTITTLIGGTLPTTGTIGLTQPRVPVYLFTDSYGTLPSATSPSTVYYIELTSLTYPITFNLYDSSITENLPLTGTLSAGATSASLLSAFNGTGGSYTSLFSSGDIRVVTYTNGSTTISWTGGLTGSTTANVELGYNLDIQTGSTGTQYFSAFSPTGGSETYLFTAQRLNLPYFENATCMAELGNTVIIGGTGSVLYPWDQVAATPADLIYLPENYTYNLITVENVTYAFVGNKGNVYVTSGASASAVITVPDYCAGIPGSTSSYYEPYFSWGGAMYLRSRLYFSIQDQTSIKTGNCGGIWSFVPTQSAFINQDVGSSLRLENQSSYGTYNGMCPVLLSNFNQNLVSPQYFSAWYSSVSTPTYGIDTTGTTTGTTSIIETDLIPTGDLLDKKTFEQITYKVSSPLQNGESVSVKYRTDGTSSYQSLGTINVNPDSLSGYYTVNFQSSQWLQFQITMTPLNTSSSSYCRLVDITVI